MALRTRLVAEVLVERKWGDMNERERQYVLEALHAVLPPQVQRADLSYGPPQYWRIGARTDTYWLSWTVTI
jgi:hypothetical protein